jgi:hypothetical protein
MITWAVCLPEEVEEQSRWERRARTKTYAVGEGFPEFNVVH